MNHPQDHVLDDVFFPIHVIYHTSPIRDRSIHRPPHVPTGTVTGVALLACLITAALLPGAPYLGMLAMPLAIAPIQPAAQWIYRALDRHDQTHHPYPDNECHDLARCMRHAFDALILRHQHVALKVAAGEWLSGNMDVVQHPKGRLVARCFFSTTSPDGVQHRDTFEIDFAHRRTPSFWQRLIGWAPLWTWVPTRSSPQKCWLQLRPEPMSAHQRMAFLADVRRRAEAA